MLLLPKFSNHDAVKIINAMADHGTWTYSLFDFRDAMIAKGVGNDMTADDIDKFDVILDAVEA
jgi:hypothetical protein